MTGEKKKAKGNNLKLKLTPPFLMLSIKTGKEEPNTFYKYYAN